MNFSSINFEKLMKIVFFCQLIHDTYHEDALLVMYCHSGIYFPETKIWKIDKHLLKYKILAEKFSNFSSETATIGDL